MKKIFTYSVIFTCIFIFTPLFSTSFSQENADKNNTNKETVLCNNYTKRAYYIKFDNTKVYEDSSGADNVKFTLNKNQEIIAYERKNGYIYCEENKTGRFGWVKGDDSLKDVVYHDTEYILDINLNSSDINIIRGKGIVKTIPYFLNDDESHIYSQVPVGIFYISGRGSYNCKNDKRYYLKFFSNYIIHSIPIDEKCNIIEGGENKLGFNITCGSIRISTQDSKWMFDFIPEGSAVIIHY